MLLKLLVLQQEEYLVCQKSSNSIKSLIVQNGCKFGKNLQFTSDVTIIESKSKIAILARNRIGSKLQFPCTTETILSIVEFAHSRCRAVMRYRSHQCFAGARTCLSSAGERWVTAAGLKCDCGRGACTPNYLTMATVYRISWPCYE